MLFKIKTSKKTMDIFQKISGSEQLQPFILAKLALALSIQSNVQLSRSDFSTDILGLELNRQTITGEFDLLFKALIEMLEKKHLNDDDYFRNYLKAHLDRGALMLANEHRYGGTFLTHLLDLEKAI
ncbi:MAG: DndE family protein [Candidatus Gastranaerophilales bacterium]|nr:DndE family protein [Candidatus Gastranaerophilales bacterium]